MPRVAQAERLLAGAWLLLLGWQLAWHALLPAPSGSESPWLALFAALPLALLTRGILRARQRSRFWSMFVVMLYLMIGIVEAWANPPQRLAAAVQIGLCLAYIWGLLWISPRRLRQDH